MKILIGLLKAVRLLIFPLLFVATLSFLMLSHTVVSVATAAGAVLSNFGAVSVVADAVDLKRELAKRDSELAKATKTIHAQDREIASKVRQLNRTQSALAKQNAEVGRLVRRTDELERIRTVNFRGKRRSANEAALLASKGIASRTKKVAASNVASAVGESIPFYGIAIIVAATGYELNSACLNMRDLHELQVSLGEEKIVADADFVCGLQVPTKEQLWATVKQSPSSAWEAAKGGASTSAAWASDLKSPDFSGMLDRLLNWF